MTARDIFLAAPFWLAVLICTGFVAPNIYRAAREWWQRVVERADIEALVRATKEWN